MQGVGAVPGLPPVSMLPPHVGMAAAHWLRVCTSLSSQVCLLLFCLVGGLVGALEAVLDSNTEVAPF